MSENQECLLVKDSDAEENPPLSGMIVRDRRLVPIYPTSEMRYPPIIVALSRDLEFNLSIRRRGTWYPIAPSASKRDSTSCHFSSNFRESVASSPVGGERASELITRSVSLPSSQRDITRTWKGAVRNGPARRAVGYFYLNGDAREKDLALVLLCERSV